MQWFGRPIVSMTVKTVKKRLRLLPPVLVVRRWWWRHFWPWWKHLGRDESIHTPAFLPMVKACARDAATG